MRYLPIEFFFAHQGKTKQDTIDWVEDKWEYSVIIFEIGFRPIKWDKLR